MGCLFCSIHIPFYMQQSEAHLEADEAPLTLCYNIRDSLYVPIPSFLCKFWWLKNQDHFDSFWLELTNFIKVTNFHKDNPLGQHNDILTFHNQGLMLCLDRPGCKQQL